MKINRIITIFALGLMATSFAAKAENKTQAGSQNKMMTEAQMAARITERNDALRNTMEKIEFENYGKSGGEKTEILKQSGQAQTQQEWETALEKNVAFDQEFDKKLGQIMKNAGPKTRAALKDAALNWVAYQQAVCNAVQSAYSLQGHYRGEEAAIRCNVMLNEDFLKIFDHFGTDLKNSVR